MQMLNQVLGTMNELKSQNLKKNRWIVSRDERTLSLKHSPLPGKDVHTPNVLLIGTSNFKKSKNRNSPLLLMFLKSLLTR